MRNKGFTLIELLVVICILAIVALIGLVAFSNILKSSRDTKRQADLKLIQSALERYHSDQFFYPCIDTSTVIISTTGPTPPPNANGCLEENSFEPFDLSNATKLTSKSGRRVEANDNSPEKYYLSAIPEDPAGGNYFYMPTESGFCDNENEASKCRKYCLYARLENLTEYKLNGCPSYDNYNFAVPSPD